MPITAPPAIPQITDPATFSVRAQDWVVWQAEQLYPEIIAQSALLALSLSGTSVTSNTIETGSKSFTVQTSKGFAAGQSIVIARTSASTNRMFCVVTSYNSGTGALVVTSQAFEGTGTFTDWTISPTLNAVLTAAQVPDGLITTDKIADDQVTFAKMQNIATSKLLGRASASSGDVEELGIGSGLSLSGSNLTATIKSGNSVAASGTSVDFTGIPAWVKRITVMFNGVSLSGTSNFLIKLGDSGGIENTGYSSGGTRIAAASIESTTSTAGFVFNSGTAVDAYSGATTICNISGNIWVASGICGSDGSFRNILTGGTKTLSTVLTQIRITTVNGTDTFDAGTINIIYE